MHLGLKHILRPCYHIYSRLIGIATKFFHPNFPLTPTRLSIYITKKCNLTCDFCYTKDALNTPEPNALSMDEWKKIVDTIPRSTIIDFCGGEIFFSKHMMPLLEYLSRKKRIMTIITNGTTMTKGHIDFFIKNKITYYLTSIDGMEKLHDKIRGKKGTFKRASEMVKYLEEKQKETGSKFPLTCVKTVITEDNYKDIPELLRFSEHELGVDNIQFSFIHNNKHRMVYDTFDDYNMIPTFKGNTYQYPPNVIEDIKETVRYILKYKKTSKMFIGIDPRLPKEEMLLDYLDNQNKFGVKKCNRHWGEYFLHYDGQLASCITYNLGNIRDVNYNVKKVLGQKGVKRFLKYMDSQMPYIEECRSCCKAEHKVKT